MGVAVLSVEVFLHSTTTILFKLLLVPSIHYCSLFVAGRTARRLFEIYQLEEGNRHNVQSNVDSALAGAVHQKHVAVWGLLSVQDRHRVVLGTATSNTHQQ